jgi:hypothetical protein
MQPWFRRHLTAFRHVNGRGLASIAHLPDPHLTRSSRAFPPRRSAQRSSANAPVGGLKPPPAGRLQRAKTTSIASTAPHSAGPPSTNPSYLLRSRSQHLSHSTTYKKTYLHRPPSVFGTHGCFTNQRHWCQATTAWRPAEKRCVRRASAGLRGIRATDSSRRGAVLLALDHKQFPVRHLCETASVQGATTRRGAPATASRRSMRGRSECWTRHRPPDGLRPPGRY